MKTHINIQSTSRDEEYQNRNEVASRWHCSVETIKRRERAGILKAYKLGKLVRYRLSDILKLEAEAEVSL